MGKYKIIDVIYNGYEIEIGKHKINNQLYFHNKNNNSPLWYRISYQAIKDLKLFMETISESDDVL